MKHWRVPLLLDRTMDELRINLQRGFRYFWPAGDNRDIHEGNMLLHLGAILKRNNANIYAEVSTNDYPHRRVDFVGFPEKRDWFLICEAKRGYGKNHITGILQDIGRIRDTARSKTFKEYGYSTAYGLILVTCWSTPGKRALIKTWDNLQLTNASHMDKACRDLKAKFDNLHAKLFKLRIQKDAKQEHYLLYAIFKIDLKGRGK